MHVRMCVKRCPHYLHILGMLTMAKRKERGDMMGGGGEEERVSGEISINTSGKAAKTSLC